MIGLKEELIGEVVGSGSSADAVASERPLNLTHVQLLSDVRVVATVELGEVVLSVEDILDLHSGMVLECALDPLRPLRLRVEGEWLADAELVSVEGQLGLRILSVFDGEQRKKLGIGANEVPESRDNNK